MADNTERKAEDYQGGGAAVSSGAGAGAAPALANRAPYVKWFNDQIAKGRNLTLDLEGRELQIVEFLPDNHVKVERLTGGTDTIVLTETIFGQIMDQMV